MKTKNSVLFLLVTVVVMGLFFVSFLPRTDVGQEIEFDEIEIKNNAVGSTSQTICSFTNPAYPEKQVIRTQKEYENYLAEAESRGYAAFAKNRDNDRFGTYIKYRDIATLENYRNYCRDQYNFPQPDFNKNTLLGQFTRSGGCSANFNKKVLMDKKNKIVNYRIDVRSSGECEKIISSDNWILIPAIAPVFTVNFEVFK